ncbi:hypothetical protein [Leptotrichia alba]|uniref:NERD domain-containing protein n=1 Tax=Leptotrichia alba TaxID=3239304 RepID=A0AB39V3S2_9FUSO
MMMNDMLKKYNNSSLKDTSKDNEEYMTNSEKIKVINFDNLSKKGYSKMLRLKGQSFPFKTNDALYLDVENNKFIFIEFKNGSFSANEKNFKEKELPQLELKIIGSMYILQEITGKSFKELREITDYILVYNKEKNPHIFSAVDMGNYIVNLGTLNNKKITNPKEGISFGLEKFKGYCFQNVNTYSKEEFEEKFVKKIEKRM